MSGHWRLPGTETISHQGGVYLRRLRLTQTPWGGVYVHFIKRPDWDRALHCHPWVFRTWVLRGGYTELIAPTSNPAWVRTQRWKRWTSHRFPLTSAHRITAVKPNTTTLVLLGRNQKSWGFYTSDGYVDWRSYTNLGESS